MKKSLFVKVSGDSWEKPLFIHLIEKCQNENYHIVICVGGGTQINQALADRGVSPGPHGPMGRELVSLDQRRLAREVLEKNQLELQDKLSSLRICATVIIPVMEIGSVLCHVNGDQMVRTAYIGFDKLIVITEKDRVEKKRAEFENLPKVEVVGI